MTSLGFLILASVLDATLSTWFQVDYASINLSLMPQMAFMAMILLSVKLSWKTALGVAFMVGMWADVSSQSFLLMHAFAYASTVVLIRYWSRNVNDAYVELSSLLLLSVFIKELIIWGLMRLSGMSFMNINVWFVHHQFLTLLGNIPLAVLVIFLNFIRIRLLARQDFAKQKGEQLFWIKLENR